MSWIDDIIKCPRTGLEGMFVMDAVISKAQYVVDNKEAILLEDRYNRDKGKHPLINVQAWIDTAERFLEESKKV
jgi:hypothetical protein